MANVITVTALNRYVKSLLESDAVLTDLAIRGEIQNFIHHRSGHFYFSLKDENCSVKAVMFRSNASRLSFEPENGMRVVVRCRISLYERDGAFQIYVDELFPDGIGAAQMAFEQLKAKLEKEGLFSVAAKKKLPSFPQRIGLVTSKSGAALHDILSVASRRWPNAQFLLAHAGVQGREAEDELVRALHLLELDGRSDVIIIARGGGSREDLWVFNGETLARAVYACKIPVVSAVGHEIDYTILDFVADLRAATPTAAAELVLPDRQSLSVQLDEICEKSRAALLRRRKMWYTEYNELLCHPAFSRVRRNLEGKQRELALTGDRLSDQAHRLLHARQDALAQAAALLDSLSPYKTLSRGYCIARQGEKTIRSGEELTAGDQLELLFLDARAICRVEELKKRRFSDEEKTEF